MKSVKGKVAMSAVSTSDSRVVVKGALARALWHSGPGLGMSGEGTKEAFQNDLPDINVVAERVLMHLERQGIYLMSMDE